MAEPRNVEFNDAEVNTLKRVLAAVSKLPGYNSPTVLKWRDWAADNESAMVKEAHNLSAMRRNPRQQTP